MSRLIMVRAWSIVTTERTLILLLLSCQGSLWSGLIVITERTLILLVLSCQGSLWSRFGSIVTTEHTLILLVLSCQGSLGSGLCPWLPLSAHSFWWFIMSRLIMVKAWIHSNH